MYGTRCTDAGDRLSSQESKFKHQLEIVGTIVGILAVLVPASLWTIDHFRGSTHGTTIVITAPPATTGPTTSSAPTTPVGGRILLTDQPIESGGENKGSLPRALNSQPGYAAPLVMPCPTNNTGDKDSSITFLLHGHFLELDANMRPYHTNSDESQIQYSFYPDSSPRLNYLINVNSAQPTAITLDGVQKLTVTIRCDDPDATAILTNAYLIHS